MLINDSDHSDAQNAVSPESHRSSIATLPMIPEAVTGAGAVGNGKKKQASSPTTPNTNNYKRESGITATVETELEASLVDAPLSRETSIHSQASTVRIRNSTIGGGTRKGSVERSYTSTTGGGGGGYHPSIVITPSDYYYGGGRDRSTAMKRTSAQLSLLFELFCLFVCLSGQDFVFMLKLTARVS